MPKCQHSEHCQPGCPCPLCHGSISHISSQVIDHWPSSTPALPGPDMSWTLTTCGLTCQPGLHSLVTTESLSSHEAVPDPGYPHWADPTPRPQLSLRPASAALHTWAGLPAAAPACPPPPPSVGVTPCLPCWPKWGPPWPQPTPHPGQGTRMEKAEPGSFHR